jgi:peptidoglycan hydrolase-like protein with peptidoglycan-binding domain
MAISNDPSFDGVSSESYQTSRSWTLPAGLGSKTIYVRFYNSCGISSSVFSTTIEVIAPTTPDTGSNPDSNNNGGEVLGEKINASIDDLIARLRYGQRNEDVLALQQALAAVGLMPRGWHATNYYGPVTLAAVTRYVDSHAGNLDELIGRLRYGTTHPDVRRLQRLLVSRNLMPRGWRISSYYGTATRSAVARYQASR